MSPAWTKRLAFVATCGFIAVIACGTFMNWRPKPFVESPEAKQKRAFEQKQTDDGFARTQNFAKKEYDDATPETYVMIGGVLGSDDKSTSRIHALLGDAVLMYGSIGYTISGKKKDAPRILKILHEAQDKQEINITFYLDLPPTN